MKSYMTTGLAILVVMFSVTLSACQPKDEVKKSDVKAVPNLTRLVAEPVTVGSLDKRVSAIEARNARIDANIRKARAAKPAQ